MTAQTRLILYNRHALVVYESCVDLVWVWVSRVANIEGGGRIKSKSSDVNADSADHVDSSETEQY